MDFIDFLKEKRATILIGGGLIIIFIWFILMTSLNLFTIAPFGNSISMGWTLLIAIILAPILLFATYWGGSEDSPVYGTFIHDVARLIYIAFKNFMIVLAIFTILLGLPRLKYYQMRAHDYPASQMSYYQQRTIFNLFRQGSYIVEATADHSEEVVDGVGVVPVAPIDADTPSSSSSSRKSDGWDDLAKALLQLLIILVVILAVVYFFGLVFLSIVFADFWLVAIVCIAIGMICLGIIDIHDGPYV